MRDNRFSCFLLLALVLVLRGAGALAQSSCPPNVNFENGNLNYWHFYTGYNNGTAGIAWLSATSPLTGRQMLTSGTGTDYYGGFPVVDPMGGSYSLKLGNDQTGAEVDEARYFVHVPTGINNYSLVYRYAVVLEDPTHLPSQQPFFRVRVYDSTTGAIVNCASFTYVSQSSIPGFSTSTKTGNHNQGAVVYYKPWSTGSLNLSGQAGKTMVVEFTAADCSLGAHMGYGYVDMSCGLFAISSNTCNATTPLSAPWGFKTYTWYDSSYATVIDTGQNISLPTPTTLTKYHVVLMPYPGYGCPDTLTTQIMGSGLALTPMRDTSLCNGTSVTLRPGVSNNLPVSYSWAPSATLSCSTCANPVATPTSTTTYTLTVVDSFGCVGRDTVTVAGKILLNTTAQNAPCFGLPGGSATAIASAGKPPYSYTWSTTPMQTGATATALPNGYYTVTAMDSLGCTARDSVTISAPPKLVAAISSKVSVSCFGSADGATTATATGGTAPYSYSWSTTPATIGAHATSLASGIYIVTATDGNGCSDTESVHIEQPSALSLSAVIANVVCFGDSSGSASVSGAGGTAPYQFAVDGGSFGSSSLFPHLTAGSHTLHLKDAHGCTADSVVIISQPSRLSVAFSATQPLCFGATVGAVSLNASGGQPPYQYAMGSGTFGSTAAFSGLSAGSYVVHAKDAAGCLADTSLSLGQPTPIDLAAWVTDALCHDSANGAISLSATGGNSPYNFALDNGSFGTSAVFSGIAAGAHVVHVKDASGCTKDSAITIAQPNRLQASFVVSQPACFGTANGSIAVSAAGGTMPYQYAVGNGAFSGVATLNGLGAGSFAVHIKDANGCSRDSTLTLAQPAAITLSMATTAVSCFGGSNGTALATVGGGTAPYGYSWTGSTQTTASASGLSAGAHSLTVTDAHGCNATANFTIAQPTALQASAQAVAPLCHGAATGSATAVAAGGTSPYAYRWNTTPLRSTATATGLVSGGYTVIVTDAAGCTANANATVPATPALSVSVVPVGATCHGGSDGNAIAAVSNGKGPFSFTWNTVPARSGDSISGLSAGSYTVNVTSADGCPGTGTVTITEPQPLNLKIASKPTCPGIAQGSLAATASGGNAGYSYRWNTSPEQHTAIASGLAAGSYWLLVTDSRGCTDSMQANVLMTDPPQVDAGPDQELCVGSSATLSGSGAVHYSWSPAALLSCSDCPSPSASPRQDTTFTLIGTDVNGCKDTDLVRVTVVQRAPVAVDGKRTICEGDSLRLGVTGGEAWQWLPPVNAEYGGRNPLVRPVVTTGYQVVVVENNCFKDTLTQQVEVLPTPVVDLGPDLQAPNGSTVQLRANAAHADSIAWWPATGMSCPDCYNPEFVLHGRTVIVARVSNILGCAAYDTLVITDVCDDHAFFFPNVFTPNGDGNNDRFYPQGAAAYKVQHFMIYDRWGETVFSATDITVNDASAGWDGTFRGQPLKPDVYIYVMDAQCENGQKTVLRGDVTLIR